MVGEILHLVPGAAGLRVAQPRHDVDEMGDGGLGVGHGGSGTGGAVSSRARGALASPRAVARRAILSETARLCEG